MSTSRARRRFGHGRRALLAAYTNTGQPRQEITVTEKRKLAVGMLLYPGMTQLDLTGPYEVFCRMPDTSVSLLSATSEPVRTEWGLTITPDRVFADSEAQDILCVPGGWGVNEQLEN